HPATIAYDPVSGDLVVANQGVPTLSVIGPGVGVCAPCYPVTVTATGLPSAAAWSVTLNVSEPSAGYRLSTTRAIYLRLPNGTYPFAVRGPTGYGVAPATGNLTVRGAATNLSITFTAPPSHPTRIPPGDVILLAGGGGAAAVLVGAGLLLRRRPRSGSPDPAGSRDASRGPLPPGG
ncbi:MAG TPA: hypothetical protein VMH49_03555, partial [Thermoplasmata archaeon]|nr:hypothetical protein [Thermoplasmata archaeon]